MHRDYKSKFDELQEKDSSFSVYYRIIQTLAIEIFKFLNGLCPQIMNEVFQVKSLAPYYLRDKSELYSKNPKTVTYETESVSFMTPKIWSIVLQKLKKLSISTFFQKRYKEMETKLSMSVMQNLLPTCWFHILIMSGTGIKTFFILLILCYIMMYFLFLLYFSPLKGRY